MANNRGLLLIQISVFLLMSECRKTARVRLKLITVFYIDLRAAKIIQTLTVLNTSWLELVE